MGKSKKRKLPDVNDILERPWCFYCERDFDDNVILTNHQKAKHFKCEDCGRRLNTIGGLNVHLQQVHKKQLKNVENALPNRDDIYTEIFGMVGIPVDVMMAHKNRITEAFFKREAERRAATGNPGPGQQQGGEENVAKKRKVETTEELKARLAEHRVRRHRERLESSESGNSPPEEGAPANGSTMPPQPPMLTQPPMSSQPPMPGSTQAMLPHQLAQYPTYSSSSPPQGFNPYQPPPQQGYPPFAGSPMNALPPFSAPGYSSSPYSPYSPMGQVGQYPPPGPYNNGPNQRVPVIPWPNGGSFAHTYQAPRGQPQQQQWLPANTGPPTSASGMMPSLPQPAPGLPQRPSFSLPGYSREEMAKMHTGGVLLKIPKEPTPIGAIWTCGPPTATSGAHNTLTKAEFGDEVDDLISSVTGGINYGTTSADMIERNQIFKRGEERVIKREEGVVQRKEPVIKREPNVEPEIKSEPRDDAETPEPRSRQQTPEPREQPRDDAETPEPREQTAPAPAPAADAAWRSAYLRDDTPPDDYWKKNIPPWPVRVRSSAGMNMPWGIQHTPSPQYAPAVQTPEERAKLAAAVGGPAGYGGGTASGSTFTSGAMPAAGTKLLSGSGPAFGIDPASGLLPRKWFHPPDADLTPKWFDKPHPDLRRTPAPGSSPALFTINIAAVPTTGPTPPPVKKSKKLNRPADITTWVYPDAITSPEEKMAQMSRYAFDRVASEKKEFVQDDVSGAVTAEKGDEVMEDAQDDV